MGDAVLCPVCSGSGRVEKDQEEQRRDRQLTGVASKYKVCHGCGGTGWIEVSARK